MSPSSHLPSFLRPLVEFLVPPACLVCGSPPDTPGERVCARCWSAARTVDRADPRFRETLREITASGAVSDLAALWYFERDGTVQHLLHAVKYGGMRRLGRALGERLGGRLPEHLPDLRGAALVPVPLHRAKERERGYNQSAWICRGIAAATRLPVEETLLRRTRLTRSQTGLAMDARRRNVRGAFVPAAPPAAFRGRTLLLVDDVITTGSTMEACASVLREQGAQRVLACALALAPRLPAG